jgi:5-methylcytosine-specific restriction endonuclease McrA
MARAPEGMQYACIVCGRRASGRRCDRHQLRRRARGNAFKPTRERIAARDGWVCQLCGDPINPVLRRPHPQALHVDHVTPHADGGTDADANLRATHALCNLRRGRVR